mmetsp:Transcript_11565/g.48436  ORF Transcript_11565/g.48436 Transcript_11565/m.48436 type:complete len:208 (+) Transcript_11565:507-1130(+)
MRVRRLRRRAPQPDRAHQDQAHGRRASEGTKLSKRGWRGWGASRSVSGPARRRQREGRRRTVAGQRHEHDALRGAHRVAVRNVRRGQASGAAMDRAERRRRDPPLGVDARGTDHHHGDEPGGHDQDAAVHGRRGRRRRGRFEVAGLAFSAGAGGCGGCARGGLAEGRTARADAGLGRQLPAPGAADGDHVRGAREVSVDGRPRHAVR